MDSTVWVAVLTGGTAILAGWVTSHGNARAAKIQAEASALAQHRIQLRDTRWSAYLALIEQAHRIGELYWRLGDIDVQVTDPDQWAVRLDALRTELRDGFDPLMRCVRVVVLEGPAPVSQAGERVLEAARQANSRLSRVAQNENEARSSFDEADRTYRAQLEQFIDVARTAMGQI